MSKKKRPLPQTLGLPCFGVDSHAHLDLPEFTEDWAEVIDRARQSGLRHIGNVFLGPQAYLAGKDRLGAEKDIFFLLGIHPNDSEGRSEDNIGQMADYFSRDARLRAVGEIGLDYYRDRSAVDMQKRFFQLQLEMARSLDMPVAIHCRDAFADTIRILDDMGFADRPLLWHCFTEDRDRLAAVLRRGWQVSLPGPVSYKKNEALREAAAFCPVERMLLETDAPFLAPEPWRGKRNEPAFTVFTARAIAELKNMPVETLWQQCGDNARAFFGLED